MRTNIYFLFSPNAGKVEKLKTQIGVKTLIQHITENGLRYTSGPIQLTHPIYKYTCLQMVQGSINIYLAHVWNSLCILALQAFDLLQNYKSSQILILQWSIGCNLLVPLYKTKKVTVYLPDWFSYPHTLTQTSIYFELFIQSLPFSMMVNIWIFPS